MGYKLKISTINDLLTKQYLEIQYLRFLTKEELSVFEPIHKTLTALASEIEKYFFSIHNKPYNGNTEIDFKTVEEIKNGPTNN